MGKRVCYSGVTPDLVHVFAAQEDASLPGCLSQFLNVNASDRMWDVARLPMSLRDLSLHSAARLSPEAYWRSWADSLHTVQHRRTAVSARSVQATCRHSPIVHLAATSACREILSEVGFDSRSGESQKVANDQARALSHTLGVPSSRGCSTWPLGSLTVSSCVVQFGLVWFSPREHFNSLKMAACQG